jgi:DNA primase
VLSRYDLDRADGRIDALREAARLVSSIRDKSKVDGFARELAGMIGVEVEEARAEVRRAAGQPDRPAGSRPQRPGVAPPGQPAGQPSATERRPLPDLRDPRFQLERETLKLVVQHPGLMTGVV